jgi:hypothetical protein
MRLDAAVQLPAVRQIRRKIALDPDTLKARPKTN